MDPLTGMVIAILAIGDKTPQDRKMLEHLHWGFFGFLLVTAPWFWWVTIPLSLIFGLFWMLSKLAKWLSKSERKQVSLTPDMEERTNKDAEMQQQLENELIRERNERLGYK